ncbi:transmembrane prolyl 4-hydroxylase-like [Glandiceps talaboti]
MYKDPESTKDTCTKEGDGTSCEEDEMQATLVRLDGVEVGYEKEIELVPGKKHYMKTINMKPVIFEIPHFFSDEECDQIIKLAEKEGLQSSITKPENTNPQIRIYDFNGDKQLNFNEMRVTLEDAYDIYLEEDNLKELYAELKLDKDGNDLISQEEMNTLSLKELNKFLVKWTTKNPTLRSRYSQQAWIYPDQVDHHVVEQFQQRMHRVLQLPKPLIDKHSTFQVVKYDVGGHYNAHIDSGQDISLPCCHLTELKKCRLCRFVTVMAYLNDVEEGGETAFPIANNDSFNIHVLRRSTKMNLNRHCQDANLMVKPEKGKVVIWYSHFIDEESGWLGDVDSYSLHGGCPVTKGTKWIANRWINVSPDKEVDLKYS